MKKLIFSLTLLAVVSLTSCKKDDPIVTPEVSIEAVGHASLEGITLPQNGSALFKVKATNTLEYAVSWSVDGEKVSAEKEFKFTTSKIGEHTIALEVLNNDGGKSTSQIVVKVYGKYKYGTFILNEGNMTTENGSLVFISPEGELIDSAYWRENGSFLGNTAQDLCIADNKIYIISQNGDRNGGDGMLVVANAETLKKETAFSNAELKTTVNDKEVALAWPTHVAAVANNAYIRDNNGIHQLNLTSRAVTFVQGSKGAVKNRMAIIGDKIFVPAGKNIYVIKAGDTKVADTIKMTGTVSGVIKSQDNNLWVSCTTTPAKIFKIKASDNSVISYNELGDAKVGAGFGATPGISAKGDTIYFSNATTKIYRHIFSQNKTEYLTDVKEYISNAGIVYNNLAVHPKTGEVYFNTIKGYGWDFRINNLTVFNFSGAAPLLKQNRKDYTSFPAGIFFTYNFE